MKDSHQQLSAKGLHKRYGKRWVVRDVDLNVNKGEIVGLLGPNGSGKTTIFNILLGITKMDSGKLFINQDVSTKK